MFFFFYSIVVYFGRAYDFVGGGLIEPSDRREPTTNFC